MANRSVLFQRNIAHLCDIRFHRSFILLSNVAHGRPQPVRVSFADLDYRAETSDFDQVDTGPTLLFVPGVGATRYTAFNAMNSAAQNAGVRVLIMDNFGIGGTEQVPLLHRIASWTDAVSELLIHLQIKHVALASHSAGIIYLFNAILGLRHVLHPINPLVFVISPWVAPSRSQLPLYAAMRYIPETVLRKSYWYGKCTFPFRYLRQAGKPCEKRRANGPLADASPAVGPANGLSICTKRTPPTFKSESMATVTTHELDAMSIEDRANSDQHNTPICVPLALAVKYRQWEGFAGTGDDVLLCLKRGPGAQWGCFSDFDEAVQQLHKQEQLHDFNDHEYTSPLRIETVFAENDCFIGKRGARWFDSLWPKQSDWVQYNSVTVLGTRHSEVLTRPFLAWMMQEVLNSWEARVEDISSSK